MFCNAPAAQMKTLIQQNQGQARSILVQNPALTRALFQVSHARRPARNVLSLSYTATKTVERASVAMRSGRT